jgi:hypothetical protein
MKKARRAKKRGRVALAPAQLAQVLQGTAAGAGATEAMILADVHDGAPANRRGQLDLIKYTAWLLRRHGYGGTKP